MMSGYRDVLTRTEEVFIMCWDGDRVFTMYSDGGKAFITCLERMGKWRF